MRFLIAAALILIQFTSIAQISFWEHSFVPSGKIAGVLGSKSKANALVYQSENTSIVAFGERIDEAQRVVTLSKKGDPKLDLLGSDKKESGYVAYADESNLGLWYTSFSGDRYLINQYLNKGSQKSDDTRLEHEVLSTRNTGGYKVSISDNKEFIAVLQELPTERDRPEALNVFVYNKSGKLIWKQSFETTHAGSLSPKNKLIVNNAGHVHIIKRVRKGADYSFYLYGFVPSGASARVHHRKLDLGGPSIADMSFCYTPDGKLILTGFYTATNYDLHEGYYLMVFGESGKPEINTFQRLPESVLIHYLGKKGSKPDAALEKVWMQGVHATENNIFILMEHVDVNLEKTKAGEIQRFEYGNAAIITFNKGGDYVSSLPIEKIQTTWEDEGFFSSLRLVGTDSTCYAICNTFESNPKTREIEAKTAKFKVYSADEKGKMKQQQEYVGSKGNFFFSPILLEFSGDKLQFIFATQDRKGFLPGSLQLQ